jgi:thiol-disulfide isomerase/thioredoxin
MEMSSKKVIYKECKLCGAVGYGNITCPTCRDHMPYLSDEAKKAFKNCDIGCPVGLKEGSEHHKNILKHNREIKK